MEHTADLVGMQKSRDYDLAYHEKQEQRGWWHYALLRNVYRERNDDRCHHYPVSGADYTGYYHLSSTPPCCVNGFFHYSIR